VHTSITIHIIQYLHESFPEVISPLDGVKNEHFVVWMRVAGLRQFRKPYGRVSSVCKYTDTQRAYYSVSNAKLHAHVLLQSDYVN
jgi:LEM3 (ligand-effect modulator 3) family / CDC50 family